MPRPQKATVDYFHHYVNHKKTMFILESRYQNNGYAFWFKLLEMLGKTEGHVFNFANLEDRDYFLAYTHFSEELAIEILDLLAQIKAIDEELWKDKIIWCQNFVDEMDCLYNKRTVKKPTKPNFRDENSKDKDNSDDYPHSIVEYSIVEYSRDNPPLKDDEITILKNLETVKGYIKKDSFSLETELRFIQNLKVNYPLINTLSEINKWISYKIDVPLEKKSRAHSQIQKWFSNAEKWRKEKEPIIITPETDSRRKGMPHFD